MELHTKFATYANAEAFITRYVAEPRPPALLFYDAQGSPILTASVYVDGAELGPNEICIKTWAEGEGIPEELERLGLVKRTGAFVSTGYVEAEICQLGASASEALARWDTFPERIKE